MNRRSFWFVFVLFAITMRANLARAWQPAEGPLKTRWTKDVTPEKALPEYPRPQMVRREWTNLNGLWQYAIRPRSDEAPAKWDGEICNATAKARQQRACSALSSNRRRPIY
jgi:hypothetical protein